MDQIRNLVKGSSDAVFIANIKTGIIAYANEAGCRLLGYTLDKIMGMHQTELHPPEELEFIKDAFDQALIAQRTDVRTHVLHKNGTRIPVRITAADIYESDGNAYIVGYFKDMTPVRQLEEIAFTQSHIVRAPLANALGFIELMELEQADAETKKMALKNIKESLLDLDRIIRKVVAQTAASN
jgi:PAS domain S-box-containing protein